MANGPAKFASEIESRGLSHAQVAKVLGVSRPYVTQILRGHRQPSIDVLARIERKFGIPARDFARVA